MSMGRRLIRRFDFGRWPLTLSYSRMALNTEPGFERRQGERPLFVFGQPSWAA